ncbi:MAG: DUF4468 domain-containing protein [Bacteroidales bacterium]
MKKVLPFIILILVSGSVLAQTLEAEKNYLNTLIKSGQLNPAQAAELGKKWKEFNQKYKFPVLPVDSLTGMINFTTVIKFDNLDKGKIFERCIEFIILGSGELLYSNEEYGKIIARGSLNISHKAETRTVLGGLASNDVVSGVSYVMVLTIKDNKLKYSIMDPVFTLDGYNELGEKVTVEMADMFPLVSQNPVNWERYITLLENASNQFFFNLKKELQLFVFNFNNDRDF